MKLIHPVNTNHEEPFLSKFVDVKEMSKLDPGCPGASKWRRSEPPRVARRCA